jgi:phage terminase small subunit
LARNLTKKQEVFVAEYLVDFNATRAAIAAGYSENGAEVRGSELLRNRKVSAEIEKRKSARCEKLEITADYVLERIKKVVERCMKPGMEFNASAALKGLELLGKHKNLFAEHQNAKGATLEQLVIAARRGRGRA